MAGSVRIIHAQIFSHRAAGPKFWNNHYDLFECDNFAFPSRSSGTRNYESDKLHDPCPHVEKTRRTIHNRRSRGLSVSDSIRQGGLTITDGSEPSIWFAAQNLNTVGLMQVSKLRSGKADGVSAQHTERRLFEITGTASRRSGPVKPNAVLDPERRILCQRTTAKNTSRKWTSTKPAVLRPCVVPTWCSSTRGVRVANMSTPLVCKQTVGSSGEQQVNGYRDV